MPPLFAAHNLPPRRGFSWRLALQLGAGLLASGFFLWLAVRGVEPAEVARGLEGLDLRFVAAYAAILSLGHLLRLARWAAVVRLLEPLPWGQLLAIGAVGMMAVFALPARLGEVVRPALIVRRSRLSLGEIGATVVVERLADGLCMSLILLVTVACLDPGVIDPRYLSSGYAAAGIFGGAGLLTFGLAVLWPRLAAPLTGLLGRVHPGLAARVAATAEGFVRGLRLLARPRVAAAYAAATLVIWVASGLGMYVFFQGFAPPVGGLSPLAAFTALSVLVVGIAIPSGPGNVGIFHWAVAFGVGMFGVGEGDGLLVGTLLHLLVVGCNIGYGVIGWFGVRAPGAPPVPPTREEPVEA